MRLEIYLTDADGKEDGAEGLSIYAAGSLVAESFHHLAAAGLDHR